MQTQQLDRACFCFWSLLWLFLQTIELSNGATAIAFVHGQFTRITADDAAAYALENMVNRAKDKSDFTPAKIEDFPWYHTLPDSLIEKAPRLADIGRLFMLRKKAKGNGYQQTACTAFYVAKDILFTAGHCIMNREVAKPEETLIAFVQDFNGKDKLDQKAWDARGRIVTEWWVPEKWFNDYKAKHGGDAFGFDFAFLRVNQPKTPVKGKTTFYDLVPPKPAEIKGKIDVLAVGYPSDVPDYYRPIKVNAKLHAVGDAELDLLEPKIDNIKTAKNQLVIVGKERGMMSHGSSGGPVFPNNVAKLTTANIMNVIGLLSYINEEHNKALVADKSKIKQEGVVVPLITEDVVKVLELLRKDPPGDADITTVKGKPVA